MSPGSGLGNAQPSFGATTRLPLTADIPEFRRFPPASPLANYPAAMQSTSALPAVGAPWNPNRTIGGEASGTVNADALPTDALSPDGMPVAVIHHRCPPRIPMHGMASPSEPMLRINRPRVQPSWFSDSQSLPGHAR